MDRSDGKPPGVILAGGRGKRMGERDKAFVSLAGRPLIDHVGARLAPQVSHVGISANGDPKRFGTKFPVFADSFDDHPGPLAGILAAMDWAVAMREEWVVTVPTDTPFLPKNLVDTLISAQISSRAPIVLAETSEGAHPVIGLWYTDLAESLRGSIVSGTRKVTDFTEEKHAVGVVFSEEKLANINTERDLRAAEARLADNT